MTGHARCTSRPAVAPLAVVVVVTIVGVVAPGPVATATAGAAPAIPAAPGGRADVDPWTYRPPVDAPVVDPFRPPPQPWAAGNRGLKYGASPGTPVRAIGPGVVTFAGPVAGTLHVTVLHPDGLRSSYSFVAAVRVRVDQRVSAGEVVAVAGEGLHLGVRRGDTYLDPASLWGRRVGPGRVVLVPDPPADGAGWPGSPPRHGERPGPAPPGPGPERHGLAGLGRVAGHVTAALARTGAPGRAGVASGSGERRPARTARPAEPMEPTGHTLGWVPDAGYTRRSAHHQGEPRPRSARVHPRSSSPQPRGRRCGPGLAEPLGKEDRHDAARRDHEATARGRGPLRTPDPSLEPEDEALHLR